MNGCCSLFRDTGECAFKGTIFYSATVAVWLMIEKLCEYLDMSQGDGGMGFRSITSLSVTHSDVRNECVGGWGGRTVPISIYFFYKKWLYSVQGKRLKE